MAPILTAGRFRYNNSDSSSTKHTPFQALHGYYPRTPLGVVHMFTHIRQPPPDLISDFQNIHNLVHENINIGEEYQKHYYAASHTTPITFEPGDDIMIRTEDLLIRGQPYPKLRRKYVHVHIRSLKWSPLRHIVLTCLQNWSATQSHISKLRERDTSMSQSYLLDPLIGRGHANIWPCYSPSCNIPTAICVWFRFASQSKVP